MDFRDTDSKLAKSLIELTNGDVHSVNVVQGTGRSRVVAEGDLVGRRAVVRAAAARGP